MLEFEMYFLAFIVVFGVVLACAINMIWKDV